MSNSSNPYTARRKMTNPYNKTNASLQTGYSQAGDNVEPNPLPYSQLNRPGHTQESNVIREGLDPTMFDRKTQTPVSLGNQETSLFTSVYPWFLVPRPTSANIIQRQRFDFAATNMPNNTYLDMCVLNVTRAEGTVASTTPVSIATTPAPAPTIPANNITLNPEPVNPNINSQAGTPEFPIPGGAGSTVAGTIGTYTPASIGEFYKIASFGHAEAPTATAGITYQIWVDSILLMEWSDFQWSPVTPKRDMWNFDVPIFVEKQIVLRIINETGGDITTGTMEACFAGWSEQKMGFLETDKVQIQNVAN
ncbi:hypothetical protein CMK18_21900 [Candidatus Poribacteria bacterium]|nr:hypothetical protein [Candidatus Poribacteria bacterium]